MGIYISILFRAQLALRDPVGPGFMRFIEFRPEWSQKFGLGNQISRGFPNRKYIYDTSHNATEIFYFSYVGEHTYENRIGHQAANNREE
jgi:hypothetical protein